MPHEFEVIIKYKDGHTEYKTLSRKAFLKLPMEQRRQVLTDQVEKFVNDNPNYYSEEIQ
jgi:hypothetical protein